MITLDKHPRSIFWNTELNENIKPQDVPLKSRNNYWFTCDTCAHVFKTSPFLINKGKWNCPYCLNQALCKNNDCDMCFEKSFATHPMAKMWHYEMNYPTTPRDVFCPIFLDSIKKRKN